MIFWDPNKKPNAFIRTFATLGLYYRPYRGIDTWIQGEIIILCQRATLPKPINLTYIRHNIVYANLVSSLISITFNIMFRRYHTKKLNKFNVCRAIISFNRRFRNLYSYNFIDYITSLIRYIYNDGMFFYGWGVFLIYSMGCILRGRYPKTSYLPQAAKNHSTKIHH